MKYNGYEFKNNGIPMLINTARFGTEEDVGYIYSKYFDKMKTDIHDLTEYCIITNWMCWEQYSSGRKDVSCTLNDLYYIADEYALDNFKDEELKYYIRETD